MQLIFIGESVKVIDNKTNHSYLNKYPNVPWSEIMGLRDIIGMNIIILIQRKYLKS